MIICVAEDRDRCAVGVKLLLLSIARHCREASVELFYPPADSTFRTWLRHCPQVHLNTEPLGNAYGWNVKPHALLTLLERGHDDVVWIDSDIILNKDIQPILKRSSPGSFVVAEEALYGTQDPDALRARAWGFDVGRVLPFTANSCVIRARMAHRPLLERWRELLESSVYVDVQRQPWSERPTHMLSDQDVLTALLASREYASVPVYFLRRGRDLLQYFGPYGYTVSERMEHLFAGLPPVLHSQGFKPWLPRASVIDGRPSQYFHALYLDLSPYTLEARKFREEVESDCTWMQPQFKASVLLRAIGLGYAPLVGMPLAIFGDFVRLVRRMGPYILTV